MDFTWAPFRTLAQDEPANVWSYFQMEVISMVNVEIWRQNALEYPGLGRRADDTAELARLGRIRGRCGRVWPTDRSVQSSVKISFDDQFLPGSQPKCVDIQGQCAGMSLAIRTVGNGFARRTKAGRENDFTYTMRLEHLGPLVQSHHQSTVEYLVRQPFTLGL